MAHLEVVPQSGRWLVRYEGDPASISEHDTQDDAIADARNHAREFPEPIIRVHGLNGGVHTMIVDPDHDGPPSRSGLGEAMG
ncbi:DUF2188 domain-containing protein [Conexibacter sp. SYSU D00693]|uniref:DUF2188 domain-containing protein n=1 Tax=Conexibacter sp. SYSU D00693 TaxID=2812560 RepID=UPI00196B7DF2|nr:DUF2188 domain-containing protein [Conexibacter sp. SYSU D00693]